MLLVDRLCKVGLVVTDGNGRGKGLKVVRPRIWDVRPIICFPIVS